MTVSNFALVALVCIAAASAFSDVEQDQLPWIAGISLKGANLFMCSGALIHKNWVVSSASCKVEIGDTLHLHRHDMYNFVEDNAEKIAISQIITHPSADVILLRMCEDAQSQPVEFSIAEDFESLLTAGWGQVSLLSDKLTGEKTLTKTLRQTSVALSACEEAGICASPTEEAFVCKQVPGTPMFHDGGLVALGSVGGGCGPESKPSVYVPISSVSEWIEETVSANAGDCSGPVPESSKCGSRSSCGACAGSKQGEMFCYWCATSESCFSEEEWKNDDTCEEFIHGKEECGTRRHLQTDSTNSGKEQ